ncbi:MAG: glycosyltransferase family 2 protein [Gemmatimonadetes bacterium]|nr:glycosyltransferase family 2 protein [Gemmatimonadota bacterium]
MTTASTGGSRADGDRTGASQHPRISVIVPAHRGGPDLRASLTALLASDLDRSLWELVVAVDGDTMDMGADDAAVIAMEYADVVIRLPGKPRGPSYVRNRASEVARGDILVFVDSDVCVHEDTLRRFLERFDAEHDVAAIFGAYDDAPRADGIVSKYRNLLHHYVHVSNSGPAETFWAGCGAIRYEAFYRVGGYDEWHFSSPQIEDIELGRRLRRNGYRIELDGSIQACHLKHWTFGSALMTDLKSRGVPWMRLLLHEGPSAAGSTLNISGRNRLCVALTAVMFGILPAIAVFRTLWPLAIAGLCLLVIALLNVGFLRLVYRSAGPMAAWMSVPLLVMLYLASGLSAISGWLAYSMVGAPLPPADVLAFREIGIETWPPVPRKPRESVWYDHGL